MFLQMADLVVSDGYHDVGYTYVNVDDCWLSHERDRRGRLQADPLRFPSGMGALADYVSSAGDSIIQMNNFHFKCKWLSHTLIIKNTSLSLGPF